MSARQTEAYSKLMGTSGWLGRENGQIVSKKTVWTERKIESIRDLVYIHIRCYQMGKM